MIVLLISVWVLWTLALAGVMANALAVYYKPLRDIMFPRLHVEVLPVSPSSAATVFFLFWVALTLTLMGVHGVLG